MPNQINILQIIEVQAKSDKYIPNNRITDQCTSWIQMQTFLAKN